MLREIEKLDLKMYILVKDTLPIGRAINYAVHAGIKADHKWGEFKLSNPNIWALSYDKEYQDWLNNDFRKVTCVVNEDTFNQAKTMGFESFIWKDDEENVMIIHPKHGSHKWLNYLKLYK